MIEALVFDLDDTLYLESDFVSSGYRAIARYIARRHGCHFHDVFQTMMSVFVTHGRENVLPVVLHRFLHDTVPLSELVEVYRSHTPRIRLFPGYGELLDYLHQVYRLGLITDGLPEVQKRKVTALGLEPKMDQIIYTWEYGAEKQKPHPESFLMMMQSLRTTPLTTLFIGDNREKDCEGSRNAGMKYCRVSVPSLMERRTETIVADKNDSVLDSLLQLPRFLEAMEGI